MEPISEHFVFFTPDIHAGTKIDLVSSLLYLNQSIILSSLSGGLKSYYKPPVAVTTSFQANDTRPQVVVPKKRVLGKEEIPNLASEYFLKRNFDHIRLHPQFRISDCVVCMFYPSQCQMFIPFNKTVLFLPAHRFMLNRCFPLDNRKLIRMMFSGLDNVLVAAADRYDAEYINYFSGTRVPIIQASSLFVQKEPDFYHPLFEEFLVTPMKYRSVPYLSNMTHACSTHGYNCSFTTILQKCGKGWKTSVLSQFKAAIVFPYAVLSYYLNDLMSACIPLFVPSPRFLLKLQILKDVRNSDTVYCGQRFLAPKKSPASLHPYSPEDSSEEAQLYWLQFASFYSPATVTFDSWDDLAVKLHVTNMTDVFWRRKRENERIRKHNVHEWKKVFRLIQRNREIPFSYEDALSKFGVNSFF